LAKPWRHLACGVVSIYISSLMHPGKAVTRWRAKLAQVVSITAGLSDQLEIVACGPLQNSQVCWHFSIPLC